MITKWVVCVLLLTVCPLTVKSCDEDILTSLRAMLQKIDRLSKLDSYAASIDCSCIEKYICYVEERVCNGLTAEQKKVTASIAELILTKPIFSDASLSSRIYAYAHNRLFKVLLSSKETVAILDVLARMHPVVEAELDFYR